MARYLNKFKACDELNISLKELKNYEKVDKLSTTTCKCGIKLYNVSQINEKYKPSNVKKNIIYYKNKYSDSYKNNDLFIKKLEIEYRDYYVKNDIIFSDDKNYHMQEILDEAYDNNINKIIIITNNLFGKQYYASLDYILHKYSSAEVVYKSIEEFGIANADKVENEVENKSDVNKLQHYMILTVILLCTLFNF